jgi:hypothetical protein
MSTLTAPPLGRYGTIRYVAREGRSTFLVELSRARPALLLGVLGLVITIVFGTVALLPEDYWIGRLWFGVMSLALAVVTTLGAWLLVLAVTLSARAQDRPTVVSVRDAQEHPGARLLALVEHADRWELGAEVAFYEVLDKGDERLAGVGDVADRLDDGRAHVVLREATPGTNIESLKKNPPRLIVRERSTTAALRRQSGGSSQMASGSSEVQ